MRISPDEIAAEAAPTTIFTLRGIRLMPQKICGIDSYNAPGSLPTRRHAALIHDLLKHCVSDCGASPHGAARWSPSMMKSIQPVTDAGAGP